MSHAGHNVLLEPICLLKVNHLSLCERLDNIVAVAVLKELSKGLSCASEDILHGQVDNRSLHELVGVHLLKVIKAVVPKNIIFQDLHFHFVRYGLPNQVFFCQLPQLILRLLGPIRCFEVVGCDVVQHKQDVHGGLDWVAVVRQNLLLVLRVDDPLRDRLQSALQVLGRHKGLELKEEPGLELKKVQ